jgi:hypothetical protein
MQEPIGAMQMWARVSDQIFFSVLMFQLVMIGLMGIKGVLVQTLLLLPLPFLTVLKWVSSNSLFRRPQQILSLRAATDLDERDQVPTPPLSFSRGANPIFPLLGVHTASFFHMGCTPPVSFTWSPHALFFHLGCTTSTCGSYPFFH